MTILKAKSSICIGKIDNQALYYVEDKKSFLLSNNVNKLEGNSSFFVFGSGILATILERFLSYKLEIQHANGFYFFLPIILFFLMLALQLLLLSRKQFNINGTPFEISDYNREYVISAINSGLSIQRLTLVILFGMYLALSIMYFYSHSYLYFILCILISFILTYLIVNVPISKIKKIRQVIKKGELING